MNRSSQFTDETETKITISVEYFRELEDDAKFLGALLSAGVDNWSGYSFAQELYEESTTE